MIEPLYKLDSARLANIFEQFYNQKKTAFCQLGSIFGYSLSELCVEAQHQSMSHQTHVCFQNHTPIGILKCDPPNMTDKTCRLFLDFLEVPSKEVVQEIEHTLNQFVPITVFRMHTSIFPHESTVKELLEKLKFEQNALLRDHVYLQGHFENLEIWGTRRIAI